MRHGSLFSGIGGFDLAAEWMGWENVFHCEWMEFPRKVLDYHFPNADSHIDICKTDFKKYANTIDVLTGGFPCQPFSLAGKRKGTDDERYLWGEMLRAIQEIKPRFVIAENVFGITNIDGGLVFQQVCLDLENEGYEVQPFIIPACAKNAPHRRDRCWFIAQNPLFSRCLHGESNQEGAEVRQFGDTCTGSADRIHLSKGDATNTNGIGCGRRSEQSKSNQPKERKICENEQQHRDGIRCEVEGCGWNATNTAGIGLEYSNQAGDIRSEEIKTRRKRSQSTNEFETNGSNATNSNGNGFNERNCNNEINSSQGREYALGDISQSNGNGDAPNTTSTRSQARTKSRSKQHWKDDEEGRIFGWQGFPTQSPICGGDDGLPTELDGITFSKWRAESIKGYGNAIVPQIALQLFQILESL